MKAKIWDVANDIGYILLVVLLGLAGVAVVVGSCWFIWELVKLICHMVEVAVTAVYSGFTYELQTVQTIPQALVFGFELGFLAFFLWLIFTKSKGGD